MEAVDGASLHVFVDWSGSCVRPALEESWETAQQELPEIVGTHRIGRLTIWAFDEDGWCPRRLTELQLPVFHLNQAPESSQISEWEGFENIRQALQVERERERLEKRQAVEARYRQLVQEALAPLKAAKKRSRMKHETKHSDIVGLLTRISKTSARERQLILVITDQADTRHRGSRILAAPDGDTRVVILLLPAQARDAQLTIGKALTGPEQVELRSRQLRESVPWARATPYFARNVETLFYEK